MEAGRELIRYVLPGSYALLVAAVYGDLFSWAWGIPVHEIMPTAKSSPIMTVGGAMIIRFVVYQIYYAFYRSVVPLPPKAFVVRSSEGIWSAVGDLEGVAEISSRLAEWELTKQAMPTTARRCRHCRSLGVAGAMLTVLCASWYVIKVNRHDT